MNALLDAAAPLFASAFVFRGAAITWLEILAFGLSVAMVVCNIRVDVRGWPLAIAASLLYFLLFWKSRLYGDASLQLFFAGVAGWGWWQWLRGTDESGRALRVRSLGPRGRAIALAALALAWPATGLFLDRFTDTDVPWWDAFPTAASVLGQWLLGRKYVDNWPVWIVVNVVAIGLFAFKGLWLTAGLYTAMTALAVLGYLRWRRAEKMIPTG